MTGSRERSTSPVLAVLASSQLLIVLDIAIIYIALPTMQADLELSVSGRVWVVTSYTLVFGGLILLGGRISDYIGQGRALIIGLLGLAVASAVGGSANAANVLYLGRALQGASAALVAPSALALISIIFTGEKQRARAFGIYAAVSGGGATLGILSGGVLTEYGSWRLCLWVNVPLALIIALMAYRLRLPSGRSAVKSFDLLGATLAVVGLVCVVGGLTAAGADGWGSSLVVTLLTVGTILVVIFVVVESKVTSPLLPLGLLTMRPRAGLYLTALLVNGAQLSMFLFLTFYLQRQLGFSAIGAGLAFLPFTLAVIVAATVAAELVPRVGAVPLMVSGGVLGGLGMMWLTRVNGTSDYLTHLLPGEIAVGAGVAMVLMPLSNAVLETVRREDVGVASALVGVTHEGGASIGTAVLNTVFAITTGLVVGEANEVSGSLKVVEGYSRVFACGAGVFAISVICLLLMVRGRESTSRIGPVSR